jgi:hypothetical protein
MSATFHPAVISEDKLFWRYTEGEHPNFSNSNARMILEELGLSSNFEETPAALNRIDDIIYRCETAYDYHISHDGGEGNPYIVSALERIQAAMEEGKEKGATHWYCA